MRVGLLAVFFASSALAQSEVTANNLVATSNGVTLSTSQTITGAKTFSATLTAGALSVSDTITSSVASGSNAITILRGARITSGSDGYWYTDGTGGGRWVTLAGLYVGGDQTFASTTTVQGTLTANSNIDVQSAIYNSTSSKPVSIYDAEGLCVTDGSGLATVCDGVLATGSFTISDLKPPVVHGAGTAQQAIESGASAMTANELVVSFGTAFASAPSCTCTHVNTTNTNACNIKSGAAPSTTGVTFAVASGGTDVVDWICIGQK